MQKGALRVIPGRLFSLLNVRVTSRVPQFRKARLFLTVLFLLSAFFFFHSCRQVDLTAPGGSTLQIIVEPDWVPANGGVATITVIGFRSTGANLPDGTVITLLTDLGQIVPQQVETRDGRAQATFVSDHRSGTATIRAISGRDAQAEAQIQIGAAAVTVLEMGAFPAVLPRGGGTSRIVVRAYNANGNPVPNVGIFLTSSAGKLESNGRLLITDNQGKVTDRLTTEETQTTVTATAGTLTASITISVGEDNQFPIAIFDFSPLNPTAGQKVFFNAWQSTDPDGVITSYRWDFGDGKTGSGATTSHTYQAPGTYVVVLRVTDDDGYESATSRTVNVTTSLGEPPIAIISGPTDTAQGDGDGFLEVNELLEFDGSPSFDPDGGTITFDWDFGDGAKGTGAKPLHAYTSTGTFVVTLTVIDDEGIQATTQKTITIVAQQ